MASLSYFQSNINNGSMAMKRIIYLQILFS